VDKIFISSKTSTNAYVFPLFFQDDDILGSRRRPNFSRTFLTLLAERLGLVKGAKDGSPDSVTPEDIFHYIYAVFHSPGYRRRYAEFLKIDFPRLPLTGSLDLFCALARFGGELVALHLFESPKLDRPISEYRGGRAPEVEKVSWSKNTIWLNKARTSGFRGVREEVWNFHIGGYQICEKWLKDRKGRTLSKGDIAHYQKIVVALSETIRLMKEIDEVIEQHGGWPRAFQTVAQQDEEAPTLSRVAESAPPYGAGKARKQHQ
jgi:predicted helicase